MTMNLLLDAELAARIKMQLHPHRKCIDGRKLPVMPKSIVDLLRYHATLLIEID